MALPAVGSIIVRAEAPTVRYRVTSRHGSGASAHLRCLPFRASGPEVVVMRLGKRLVGAGSEWHATGEVVR